jgi:hypothetical protein
MPLEMRSGKTHSLYAGANARSGVEHADAQPTKFTHSLNSLHRWWLPRRLAEEFRSNESTPK